MTFINRGLKLTAAATAALLLSSSLVSAETVLRRGNGAEPETIDPHRSTGVTENNIENDLFEGLVTFSADGQLIPGAAESWEVSDDGLTYTFKLRADAKWSNGDPVTAGDFVYSFQRAVSPATASDYAPILAPIVNADEIIGGTVADLAQLGVVAVDDLTLTIQLETPAPYLLGLLSHNISFPVHKGNVEAFGDDFTKPGNLVSNGAYMLADWVPQSHLTVVKNPNYYDADDVKLDKVIFYPTEDVAEELKRYQAGDLDVTNTLPSDQITWLKENMAAETHINPYFGTYYYGINLTAEPLGSAINIRKALSLALDRETMVEKITQAGQEPAYAWVPPGIPGYPQQKVDFADMPMEARLEEAKKLLAEAGYGPENPLKLELLYNTSENHKKIAVAAAAMWAPLGVEVTLVNQEWGVYLEARDQKAYQVVRAAWIGDYLDPTNFLDLFVSTAGERNDMGFNNAEYDALLTASATEQDAAARMELLAQAERIFLDHHGMIPIYHYVQQYMLSPKVAGYEPNVMGIHRARWMSIN